MKLSGYHFFFSILDKVMLVLGKWMPLFAPFSKYNITIDRSIGVLFC